MEHVDEETLVALSAGLLRTLEHDAAKHMDVCSRCHNVVEEHSKIAETLSAWREAPAEASEAAIRALVQRIRLRRLLGQLFTDPSLRREAVQNPEELLAARGITPSPQLLAAFRELEALSRERFSGELDERVSKLLRLVD